MELSTSWSLGLDQRLCIVQTVASAESWGAPPHPYFYLLVRHKTKVELKGTTVCDSHGDSEALMDISG